MATYAQWAKSLKTHKVSWVCGEDSVLVEATVADIKQRISAQALDSVMLVAGEVPDAEIWAALNQYAMDPAARRFLLVRQAQKIKGWEQFQSWLQQSRQMPSMYVCFVSADADFPYTEQDSKKVLDTPVAQIKGRGAIVRCAGTEAEITAYVQSRLKITSSDLKVLLVRTGYSTARVKDVVGKILALGVQPTEDVIRRLCAENGTEDVVEALFYQRKQEALRIATRLDKTEASKVIGKCAVVLDYMEHLYPAVLSGSPLWEVVARGFVPDYPARLWWGAAKHFDPISREKARTALLVADHGAGVGGEGALEALIGLW